MYVCIYIHTTGRPLRRVDRGDDDDIIFVVARTLHYSILFSILCWPAPATTHYAASCPGVPWYIQHTYINNIYKRRTKYVSHSHSCHIIIIPPELLPRTRRQNRMISDRKVRNRWEKSIEQAIKKIIKK